MSSPVTRDDHGRVAVLTMNRPERLNAFNATVAEQLVGHLGEIRTDEAVGAVVLTGAGRRAFCAGADLQDAATHAVDSVEEHLAELEVRSAARFFTALLEFPKPLICAVHGYAVGVGFQLQLCCDVIVAATTARFQLPQVRLGIMPAYGGAPRLAQWVGRGRAAEIALSGRFVEVDEAERIGLVAAVHPPEELLSQAVELGEAIAAASPLSLQLTKESLRGALEAGPLAAASATDTYRFMSLAMTRASLTRHEDWREERRGESAAR